ncbi:MAG: hypothetical protein ACK2UO_16730 [Caldilineaceae bacterium]
MRHPEHVPEAPYPPSLVLIVPSTDKAADWLQANASGVWHGEALLCDRRYAPQLLKFAKSEGLSVEVEP